MPRPPDDAAELLSLEEAGRLLALDHVISSAKQLRRTVLAMVRRGELRGVRVSKWVMIDPRSVEKLVNPDGKATVAA